MSEIQQCAKYKWIYDAIFDCYRMRQQQQHLLPFQLFVRCALRSLEFLENMRMNRRRTCDWCRLFACLQSLKFNRSFSQNSANSQRTHPMLFRNRSKSCCMVILQFPSSISFTLNSNENPYTASRYFIISCTHNEHRLSPIPLACVRLFELVHQK